MLVFVSSYALGIQIKPVLQQGRRHGSIWCAEASLGAGADSLLHARRGFSLPPPPLTWWCCSLQGCARDGARTQSCDITHNHCSAWSPWSIRHLIHLWLLFAKKQGREVVASSANVPFHIESISTVENLEGQTSRGQKTELFTEPSLGKKISDSYSGVCQPHKILICCRIW